MQDHLIPQEKPIIILLRKYELFQELAVGQICKCVISTMGVYEFFGYQNIVSGRGLFLWQFCLQSLCVVLNKLSSIMRSFRICWPPI